ncbi:MAG: carbon-nitrogen family hydrolase [Phycisphaeraceae bacterium]
MQVIGCQLDIQWEDKSANHERVRRLLADVQVQPGALIVLPEMFATGYSMNVQVVHEGGARPTERFCAALAVEHGAYVLAGAVSPDRAGWGRNEAVAFDPSGELVARYAKMHPMTVAGEAEHYLPGTEVVTFACGEFVVSPFVCYDLRFPEIFRMAATRGAHVMPVIANWPAVRIAHWRTLLAARAIENQAYVIGVNRTGDSPEMAYNGRSVVIDPRGETIAEAGEGETALVADIELEPLLEYRAKFPALADRRV